MTELQLLQEYCMSLERENQAKNTQRQTLYNQIQRLNADISKAESQLISLKNRMSQQTSSQYKHIIMSLQQQISLLKYQQQHLFNQNLQVMDNFDKTHHRLEQLQRENKDLKGQQKQLEKFRVTLERISKTLENMEKEKYNLTESNYLLVKENSYLKGLFQQPSKPCFPCPPQLYQPEPAKSPFLLQHSFEKISEYDEQFQESQHQQDSISKSQISRSIKSQEKPEKPQIDAEMSNSSYLILDQKSRQALEHAQQHQKTITQHSSSQLIDLNLNQNCFFNPHKHYEDSCEVIQELDDHHSQSMSKNLSTDRRNPQIQEVKLENLRLRQSYKQLSQNFQLLQNHYKTSLEERQFLQKKLHQIEMNQMYTVKLMQSRIEQVISNYQKSESMSRQMAQKLNQAEQYIRKLEGQGEILRQRILKYQSLQKPAFRLAQQRRKKGGSERSRFQSEVIQDQIFQQLDKGILVRQNNLLIEKIGRLQKQKLSLYKQCHDETNQNVPLNGQQQNSSGQKKRSSSSFYDKSRQTFILSQNDRNPKGLRKRIEEVKIENERLLQTLRIN